MTNYIKHSINKNLRVEILQGAPELKLKIVAFANEDDAIWECKLSENTWAEYPIRPYQMAIITENDKTVWELKFHSDDTISHLINMWCLSRKSKPLGIVIGANDGSYGEWITAAKRKSTKLVLIEPSDRIFEKLNRSYKESDLIKITQTLVTENGGPINFYESPDDGIGLINSVVEGHHSKHNLVRLNTIVKDSIPMSSLLEDYKPDWLHIDTEGLDVKLLLSIIDSELLPHLICFEHIHADEYELNILKQKLIERGYVIHVDEDGSKENTLAIKCLFDIN